MVGSPLLIAEKARARLRLVLNSMQEGRSPNISTLRLPNPADVVITPCEVVDLHGTGVLVSRMFSDSRSIVSLRSSNFYDVPQKFGAANFCLPLIQSSLKEVTAWVKWCLAGTKVGRALCLPYLPAEPVIAIAVKELFKVPLCTFIMDDKNVCAEGISDSLMEELLVKSDLRLVISPEMRAAYEKKYDLKFWLVPPLVSEELIRRTAEPVRQGLDQKRGVLIGNVWGQRWLDMLRSTFRNTGYQVDWYCNQQNPRALTFDRDELARDGINLLEPVHDSQLPSILEKYAYAIVPSDPLDGVSPPSVQAIAELSLPSRMTFIVATSHLPILLLGNPRSAAAQFLKRFDLGMITPYETGAAQTAIRHLLEPNTQSSIRSRAASLAGKFSAADAAAWIWRSLAAGEACDQIYEHLMPTLALNGLQTHG
jgi:hypothetical protein